MLIFHNFSVASLSRDGGSGGSLILQSTKCFPDTFWSSSATAQWMMVWAPCFGLFKSNSANGYMKICNQWKKNKQTRIVYKIRSTNDSLLLNCKQIKTYRLQGLKMRLHSFAPLVVPGACKNWRKHQVHVLHMRTVLLVIHILLKKQTLSVFLLKATLQ